MKKQEHSSLVAFAIRISVIALTGARSSPDQDRVHTAVETKIQGLFKDF